jgi:hypothetical protein
MARIISANALMARAVDPAALPARFDSGDARDDIKLDGSTVRCTPRAV